MKRIFCLLLILLSLTTGFKKVSYKIVRKYEIIEDRDNYSLKISYPITMHKNVNKDIESFVNEHLELFMMQVREKKDNFKYDFIAEYKNYFYQDINYIHLVVFMYTGGAHYIRFDKQINVDKNGNIRELESYFSDGNYLNVISSLAKSYLIDYFNSKNYKYDEEWIDEGLRVNDGNFENFRFSEGGLVLMFVPYQVAPWSEGEIEITIPYEKIQSILN